MLKTRVALLGVLALFIVSGTVASTASAAGPYWRVAGARLGQGVQKQAKFQIKGTAVLETEIKPLSLKITITCHNSYSEGASIEGQGNFQGQDKGRVVFEQCKAVFAAPEECEVVSPIKTNQLKSYLAYNNPAIKPQQQKYVDVFEPQQGTTFVLLHFTGAGCLVKEAPASGAAAAEIVPQEKESQELLFNFPKEPITTIVHEQQERKIGLTVAGEPAVFSAAYGVRLATNELWGVFGT